MQPTKVLQVLWLMRQWSWGRRKEIYLPYSVQLKILSIIEKAQNVLKIPKKRRLKFLDELDKEDNEDIGSDTGGTKKGRKKGDIDILDKLFDICPLSMQALVKGSV